MVANSTREVADALRWASATGRTVTFRSGGTSLSGQALSDDLLVDTRRGFRHFTVSRDGAHVTAAPGATVRAVNSRLAKMGRKLGPDPASEIACTIGGVVANNSSGMACGVEQNTYRTIQSLKAVLPDGTEIDTGVDDASSKLLEVAPALHDGLLALRDRLRASPDDCSRVRQLFSRKNTMGYGVNALLDFDDPADISPTFSSAARGPSALSRRLPSEPSMLCHMPLPHFSSSPTWGPRRPSSPNLSRPARRRWN
jgi:D-lactate dehydrogenase